MTLNPLDVTDSEFIVLAIFSMAFIIQLFYFIVIYSRVAFTKKHPFTPDTAGYPPISVVICAKNEEENLSNFLPSVLEQDYPEYEVIVVNDCSDDDTDMLLQRLMQQYSHLRTTNITIDPKFTHGKKLALTIGIKAARHDWLLLTDADCKPESPHWLAAMASNFNDKHQVVLGYSGYMRKKGLLNRFIRYDTFFIAMQYLGFALMGKPYMGVGRNMAYSKGLFVKNRGFASHSHIPSGDDDLFVHEVANKRNTTVDYRHEAHTRSVPCITYKCWFAQKQRHLQTSKYYRFSTKIWLALEPLSRLLFWTLAFLMMAIEFKPQIVAGVVCFRLILMGIVIRISLNRLNEKKIFLISLFYDLLSPVVYFILLIVVRFTVKKVRWK